MASPNLITDVTAKVWIEEITPGWKTAVSIDFEDAATQGYYAADKNTRTWELTWDYLNASEFSSLNSFFNARREDYEKFYFNDPVSGENDIPCKFVKGSYQVSPGSGPVRTVKARIREVV